MKIELSKSGKRFNREWIFRNVNLNFSSDSSYAITGPNGTGKSTFLQVIGGMIQLNEGSINYSNSSGNILSEEIYNHTSFCAPYLEVIEELTYKEFLEFHNQFKPFIGGINIKDILKITGLEKSSDKQIRFYSSGMKQRVKLAQAIFSDTELVLLDEPCNNLDQNGIELYHSLIEMYCKNRLVIVSSNDAMEYSFCKEIIPVQRFKHIPAAATSDRDN